MELRITENVSCSGTKVWIEGPREEVVETAKSYKRQGFSPERKLSKIFGGFQTILSDKKETNQ